MLALDKQTGKEVWKAIDDPVSNRSPIVITARGRRQLIVWSDSSLASLDPAHGHTYWRGPMVPRHDCSRAHPVFPGHHVLVSELMRDRGAEPPPLLLARTSPLSHSMFASTPAPPL